MRVFFLGMALTVAAVAAAVPDYLAKGDDHYFNLEYAESIEAFETELKRSPKDPAVYNYLAKSYLYRELHRLGKLESSAFKGDNTFLDDEKPEPDPQVKAKIFDYLDRGERFCNELLKKNPRHDIALFVLSNNYALRANYQFMIDKSYLAALRSGNRARKISQDLRKHHPKFLDADLIIGAQSYVVGSLPWAIRTMIALGGVRGNKAEGEAMVDRVAREGRLARNEARVLMALVHRRERRPLEAVKILEPFLVDYPRNYVLQLEIGAMYLDANDLEKALEVFEDIQRKYERDEQRFGRMPTRVVKALERRIERVQQDLNDRSVAVAAAYSH